MNDGCAYEFGEFRIDPEKRELTHRGEKVSIRPRFFDLLLLLVVNQGKVVTKDEIIDQIWTQSIIEEGNITVGIHFLRRIIDDPDQPESRIITIPKRGYLFAAEARSVKVDLSPEADTSDWLFAVDQPEIDQPLPPADAGRVVVYGRRTRGRIGLMILILGCALLLGSYIIFKSSIRNLTILSHFAIPSHQLDPEFSPDGKFLAFSSFGETGYNEDIYLRTVDQTQRIRLTNHPDSERNPVWSYDGKRIAFLRWANDDPQQAKVIVTDDKGKNEIEVGRSRGALGWMTNGDQLIVSDLDQSNPPATVLFLVSLDGQVRRQLTSSTSPRTVDTMPRAARYRETIAFLRTSGESRGEIYLLDLPSGQTSQVTHEEGAISFFQWGLREGGFYLVSNRSGVSRLWHFGLPGFVSALYGDTGSARLVDQMPYQIVQFTILADPPLLAYSNQIEEEQVRIVEITGNESMTSPKSCQLPGARSDEPPQFSPGGGIVAYITSKSSQTNQRGEEAIWVANPDCSNRTPLVNSGFSRINHLRWSPDGLHLVYEQQSDDRSEIWTISSDGSNPARLIHQDPNVKDPSWSADGRSIYYVAIADGRETIRRIPVSGGESVTVVSTGGREPVESADGQTLYFIRQGRFFSSSLTRSVEQSTLKREERLIKEQKVVRNWQLGPTGEYFLDHSSNTALLLNQLDFSTGKIERITRIDGIQDSSVSGIALDQQRRYFSIVLKQPAIGELTTVEGWRLKPFTEFLIDALYHEKIFYPERWLKKIW